MTANGPVPISEEVLLLVEGRDEKGFFLELCHRTGVTDLQIVIYGGKYNLANFLKTLRLAPGFDSVKYIGLVRDADERSDSAFQSVCSALSSANVPIPSEPLVLTANTPRVAVMIMPPSGVAGCLETLLWQIIEAEEIARCIEDYVGCARVPTTGNRQVKAKVHTYLAAQPTAGLKIGEAAKAGYWDFDHPALGPLKDLVRTLSSPAPC